MKQTNPIFSQAVTRMVPMMMAVASLTVALVLAPGCATTSDRFSVISTHNDAGLARTAADSSTKLVSGEACRRTVLFIPISGKASLGDAVDAALAQAPGASSLTDTKVENETLFTLLYNYHCVKIEGHPRVAAEAQK